MYLQAGWLSVEVRDFSLGWVTFCVLFFIIIMWQCILKYA